MYCDTIVNLMLVIGHMLTKEINLKYKVYNQVENETIVKSPKVRWK